MAMNYILKKKLSIVDIRLSDLKWNKHIDNISSTASKHLNFIKLNLKVNSKSVKVKAYKTKISIQYSVIGTLIPKLTSVNSKWSNAERPDTPALDSITPDLSRTCLQNSNGHNYN
jgi:hypothetical protein